MSISSSLSVPLARTIGELLSNASVRRAFEFFDSRSEEITEEQIHICSIPAPPFGEQVRAEHLLNRFRNLGLSESSLDKEGNCIALLKGRSESPLLAVSAHLDTVFPAGTEFSVRRVGNKLFAPGISDDGCGLAALIALARAFVETPLDIEGSLLLVGTVGEEGEGNLRGVRYLFTESEWANRITAFISLDGPGIDRITNGALGSRRYRVYYQGAGGHSWGDFGVANPVHALGRAIAKLASYPAPMHPRTTFNVGRIEGGEGVNSIPRYSRMDVDLRSVSESELHRLDSFFRRIVREAAEEENALRRGAGPPLELSLELIGTRPSGETPADSLLVELAKEATQALGVSTHLDQASTDSNFPIHLGIPAVTFGAGGSSGSSHTIDEWYDPRGREIGLKRALLVVLGLVGISN